MNNRVISAYPQNSAEFHALSRIRIREYSVVTKSFFPESKIYIIPNFLYRFSRTAILMPLMLKKSNYTSVKNPQESLMSDKEIVSIVYVLFIEFREEMASGKRSKPNSKIFLLKNVRVMMFTS